MGRYNVVPDGDRWRVESNGRTVSKHNYQRTAIDQAYEYADPGDDIVIHNSQGQIRDRRTVRG